MESGARGGGEKQAGVRCFFSRVADAFFPPLCLLCRGRLLEQGGVCGGCWGRIPFISRPFCPMTGLPFMWEQGPDVVDTKALREELPWDCVRAATIYEGAARAMVHGLKYHDGFPLARLMGDAMVRVSADVLERADVLVPVPLYRWRLWRRRYNQACLLARHTGEAVQKPVLLRALCRIRATAIQVGLSEAERKRNVDGAFRVCPHHGEALRGKRVVLVDDVFTTGSTAKACARALWEADIASLSIVVFSRAVLG